MATGTDRTLENARSRSSPRTPVTPDDFLLETKLVILSYLGLIPPHLHPHNIDLSSESESITSSPDSASVSDFHFDSHEKRKLEIVYDAKEEDEEEEEEHDFDSVDIMQLPPGVVKVEFQKEELDINLEDAATGNVGHVVQEECHMTVTGPGGSLRVESNTSVHSDSSHTNYTISETSSDITLPSLSVTESLRESSVTSGTYSNDQGRIAQSLKDNHYRSKSADIPHLSSAVHKKVALRLDLMARNTVSDEMVSVATEARQSIVNIRGTSHQGSGHRVISPTGTCCETPMTPQTAVAKRLALLGDQICQDPELNRRLQEAIDTILTYPSETLTYDIFQNTASHVMGQQMPGTTQVALLLRFTKLAAVGLTKTGTSGIGRLTEYATKLIADRTADFILQNGGWDAVANVDPDHIDTNPLFSSSDISLPGALSPLEVQLPPVQEDDTVVPEATAKDQPDSPDSGGEPRADESTAESEKTPVEQFVLRKRERSFSRERSDESVFANEDEDGTSDFDSDRFSYYTTMAIYSAGAAAIAVLTLGVCILLLRKR